MDNAQSCILKNVISFLILIAWVQPAHAFLNNAGVIHYVHSDQNGTPRVLTDEQGKVVWTAEYDPFGGATVNEDPDGDGTIVEFNLRAPGQYYDSETGLHYNYYRHYDPKTGRYLTPDPIGLDGGLNTFVYVENNPVRYIDPLGLSPILALPGAAAMSAPAAGPAAALAGPAAALLGAGYGGYQLGGLIYPYISQPLGDFINYVCNVTNNDQERDEACDRQYYDVDIPTCRGIAKRRGKVAGQRCYKTAADRYAACLKGSRNPELDTRNN